MAVERPLDQVSDADLFRAAQGPPPSAEPEAAPATPPAPEPAPAEPAKAEAPAEPVAAAPEPTPAQPAEVPIPSWRLREESEARRLAEQRAQLLEGRLNEVLQHIQQQKPPDFFDNPDKATQDAITRALQPVIEANQRVLMQMGREVAEVRHGADKVAAAEQAFLDARERGTLDPADYERVVGSPNRYNAAVQWHTRQAVLSSVGDDPNAWFEKQLEARMSDPQFQAKVLEKVKGSAASRPSVTRLPPSLSKATAAASNSDGVVGDLSDQSLWAHAVKR